MIREDRNSGEFTVVCDRSGCGVTESGDAANFKDFVAYIKGLGWKIVKNLNWEHFCSDRCARGE